MVKFAFHFGTNLWQVHLGFGFHRDELYYLICGQRLDWGYVDQAPLVALQAHLSTLIFGTSLAGVRVLTTVAGAARIFLTGILCWQFGGRRATQALAMLCVLMAPQYLGSDSFLSMNSCESLFWLSFLSLLLYMQRNGDIRLWLAAGFIAGAGMLNKPSMAFFLAALLLALLCTPQRRLLRSRYFPAAILLAIAFVLPCLLWQAHHHWATWEYLRLQRVVGKYVPLSLGDFIESPIDNLLPMTMLLWVGGLYYLLRDKRGHGVRLIGLTCVVFFVLMWKLKAKDYYLAPIYPALFSAGAVLWQGIFAHKALFRWRYAAYSIFASGTVIYGILVLPMALPVVPPSRWVAYLRLMHQQPEERENVATAVLPQGFADRFGWPELTAEMNRIVAALPASQRAGLGILCDNYGEASAINFFGAAAHLPVAISGHNNYFLWGPNGYTGENLLLITSKSPDELRATYASVEAVGKMHNDLALPSEQKTIYLARGRFLPLPQDWESYKWYY